MTFRLRCTSSCRRRHFYHGGELTPKEYPTAEAAKADPHYNFEVVEVKWALRWNDAGSCSYRSADDDGNFSDRAGAQRFDTAEAARESSGFKRFGFGVGHTVPFGHGYKVVRLTKVVKP